MEQTLGATVRRTRDARGLTLRDVEEQTGLSNGYLSLLENDKIRQPRPPVLYKLAEALEIPYAELMERAGYAPSRRGQGTKTEAQPVIAFKGAEKLTDSQRQEVQDFITFQAAPGTTRSAPEPGRMIDHAAIRALAAEHIRDLGLQGPPFDHHASLRARGLELSPYSLEELLAESNLAEEDRDKIDGFVDLTGRIVCLRAGLHPHKLRTGLLHEIAHDAIPWQRDLLLHHYCSIFTLPPELQRDFELEANRFAVECVFFADTFLEKIGSSPNHLRAATALANEHGASYEATFRHYVECHQSPCLLVASNFVEVDVASGAATFQVRQYIKSASAELVIRPPQRFQSLELTPLVTGAIRRSGVVDHEVTTGDASAVRRFVAQSFWNSYKLFTLIWL